MTVHPPEPGSGWAVTDHADTIRRWIDTYASAWATDHPRTEPLAALDALLAERQQAQEERDFLIAGNERLERERQQAIDALRQAQHQCRENIRRAAFAPQIGTRYTEKLRLAIADECRKLEDGIAAALVKLGEKPNKEQI